MVLNELESRFPYIYIDIEMNSLEDAYVSMAKAEEKLITGNQLALDGDESQSNRDF